MNAGSDCGKRHGAKRGPRRRPVFPALLAAVSLAAAARPAQAGDIEVHPALIWVTTDDTGRHESRVEYPAQRVASSEGDGMVIDMSQPVGPVSDASRSEHPIFDGVVLRLSLARSGDLVRVSGRADYETPLGVTSSSEDAEGDLYAQTVRRYTTYFQGRVKLGRELRIQAAEDIDDGVSVVLRFAAK